SHRWPQLLPDGRLLFFATNGPEPSGMYLESFDGTPPKRVLSSLTAAVYSPPGYILLIDRGELVARQFDPARGVLGDPVPVAQPVGSDESLFRGAFAVSSGLLAYRATAAGQRQLVWVDRAGTTVSTIGAPDENDLLNPALAFDGSRVAVQRTIDGNADVWVFSGTRAEPTRITFDSANDNAPLWSPDGRRLAFRSNRTGSFDLYERPANGGGTGQLLLKNGQIKLPLDWSRDGAMLLYQVLDPKTGFDIWALPLTGGQQPFPVVQTQFSERNGQFASDGGWIAY